MLPVEWDLLWEFTVQGISLQRGKIYYMKFEPLAEPLPMDRLPGPSNFGTSRWRIHTKGTEQLFIFKDFLVDNVSSHFCSITLLASTSWFATNIETMKKAIEVKEVSVKELPLYLGWKRTTSTLSELIKNFEG